MRPAWCENICMKANDVVALRQKLEKVLALVIEEKFCPEMNDRQSQVRNPKGKWKWK